MNNIANKSILSVAALTLAAGLSSQAVAGAIDETLVHGAAVATKTVTYDRAELATADGRARVERRIENAAAAVCGSTGFREAGSLAIASKNKACIAQATASAMSQVGADRVAAID
ncbi:UrcA family protein [Seongchinamella sediminis]|uniref:UrcA family protein n=1 Tax=Seongchinamella sediminis TaxID=2283635 RepID=A0A3L7E104_9GAMM|nr:UrcA family protein [Seongchinamella sediminis]RLQ22073.1 UrcA family protein [Seongchinamella sediminis]